MGPIAFFGTIHKSLRIILVRIILVNFYLYLQYF